MNARLGATYRLQLNGLGLRSATGLVDYLDELGIATLYVSPLTTATRGSTHGYDVVDPLHLDPALGSPEDLEALLSRLDDHGMRMLVDIVPNHMSISHENRWWTDVLRLGVGSEFARIFDIDWEAGAGKVVLPVLGRPLGEALEAGEIRLAVSGEYEDKQGALSVAYGDLVFPVAPDSIEGDVDSRQLAEELNGSKGDPGAFSGLRRLLDAQHYRLAYWKVAGHQVNYRRFFDIDGLVGVRNEDPEVYKITHRFVLDLAKDERVAGLRVDHVDGLADPTSYLDRLGHDLDEPDRRVVLVEKILARGEDLPRSWKIDGDTGYEFADLVFGLLTDPAGANRLAGQPEDFRALSIEARLQVLDNAFAGQLNRLSVRFAAGASADPDSPELTVADVRAALREMTARLPVYRTYLAQGRASASDLKIVNEVGYESENGEESRAIAIDVIRHMLLHRNWTRLAMQWQQLTSAVAAKGVEDTALYRFSGLLSSADVGSDPGLPAVNVDEFHAAMTKRAETHPGGLNATSTHDSKRSGDVRSRLAVLSEIPDRWTALTGRWRAMHTGLAQRAFGETGAPRQVEMFLYQTIVGVWWSDQSGLAERVQDCMLKSVREAKVHTSWTDPDAGFERGLESFVDGVLDPQNSEFIQGAESLVEEIGIAGIVNSLASVLLKITAPGVPDIYQGTEVWRPLLVDPDNRRPVDFAMLRRSLKELFDPYDPRAAKELMTNWRDGALKLFIARIALVTRRNDSDLFATGSYIPLKARGRRSDHVVAFARQAGDRWAIVVVPRLVMAVAGSGTWPVGSTWDDTEVLLPVGAPEEFTDVLSGSRLAPKTNAHDAAISVGGALSTLPVAVLLG